ncbi:MAG: GNAT family N-acetyltransferase, partial [Chloroflexales bacterium]|nr:GNAT family N-acetyltransferase [Chloroflexales bacterium]
MSAASELRIRDARPDEQAAIEALTVAAYEEYATVMPPASWAGLRDAVVAGLRSTLRMERIVAEQHGALLGSVLLFPADTDAYGGATASLRWPEVRLLAVSPAARGRGVGQALMNVCVRRAGAAGAAML